MFSNLLRYSVKSSVYYIKRRFIEALSVHLAVIYRINTGMAIKELIDPFVADFIKLIDSGAGIKRVQDTVNAK